MIKLNGYQICRHPHGFYVDCFSYGLVFPTLKKAIAFVLSSIMYDNGFLWPRGSKSFILEYK